MGFKKNKKCKYKHHNALTRVIQFVCNPVDIPRTIVHKRMQFSA